MFKVDLEQESLGNRLDRAILAALERQGLSCTRSRLARAFAQGLVRSEDQVLKPGRTVDRPMVVEVQLVERSLARAYPEPLALEVLHEDDDVLVVIKPASMVVHVGPGHDAGTLVNAVLHHLGRSAQSLPVLPGNDALRPGVVHRLDRQTSGVLVMAKTEPAAAHLAQQFRRHSVERLYLGVVEGTPPWIRLRVETGHGRDPAQRKRFSPTSDHARRAITVMEVDRVLDGAALLRFHLETGRTHQIRMHARHVGHPIVGDALYGSGRRAVAWSERMDPDRHALHAHTLGFEHPTKGTFLRFEAPIPPDMAALVANLEPRQVPSK